MIPHTRAERIWREANKAFHAGDTFVGVGRTQQAVAAIEAALREQDADHRRIVEGLEARVKLANAVIEEARGFAEWRWALKQAITAYDSKEAPHD